MMPFGYIFYVGISMLANRTDVKLISIRCSSAFCAIGIYIYNIYSGNAKLSMPFWFNLDISIPMLAWYSGRRQIDMDPMKFCNPKDILFYRKLFQF